MGYRCILATQALQYKFLSRDISVNSPLFGSGRLHFYCERATHTFICKVLSIRESEMYLLVEQLFKVFYFLNFK